MISESATRDVRADIFKRVNTSSSKLTSAETRKGIYQSEFYNFIIECAKNELFHELCPISKMQIRYLFYLTVFCRAAENMMNYYNQCLFIKLCGKKKNPLKVGNYRTIWSAPTFVPDHMRISEHAARKCASQKIDNAFDNFPVKK